MASTSDSASQTEDSGFPSGKRVKTTNPKKTTPETKKFEAAVTHYTGYVGKKYNNHSVDLETLRRYQEAFTWAIDEISEKRGKIREEMRITELCQGKITKSYSKRELEDRVKGMCTLYRRSHDIKGSRERSAFDRFTELHIKNVFKEDTDISILESQEETLENASLRVYDLVVCGWQEYYAGQQANAPRAQPDPTGPQEPDNHLQ